MPTNENIFGTAKYYSLWSQSIAETMSQFTGKQVGAEVAGAVEDSGEGRLWATFTISEALLGEQSFSCSRADALQLSQLFIGETPDANAEFTADHEDAFAELFRQFAGTVALQLKGLLGQDCPVRFKDAQMPAWNAEEAASLIVKTEMPITVALRMDTGLLNSVTKMRIAAEEPEPVPRAAEEPQIEILAEQAAPVIDELPPQAPAPRGRPAPAGNPITDKNLDLLLDVELEVSVRFGCRQMLLKDVLDLSSGSMVELDRRVRDPIELLLGGRVIARGEAVIVDGSYGIRITEVVSRNQRLAEIA